MDYEMKYKGALERAKMSYHTGDYDKDTLEMLEIIFPELKESEDERIRKELIRLFNDTAWNDSSFQFYDLDKQKVIDWLEKQGEINEASYRTGIKRVLDSPESYGLKRQGKQDMIPLDKVIKFLDDQLVNDKDEVTGESFINFKNYGAFKETFISFFKKKMLEKQGEPKETLCDKCKKAQPSRSCQDITALGRCYIEGMNTSSKIESKFKVGDWIVRGDTIAQILDIQEQYYVGLDINGKDFTSSRFLNDAKIHLWSIEDAKEGDVLVASDGSLFIFAKVKDNAAYYHFSLCKNGSKEISDGNHAWETAKSCHPATKEQRDLLFTKMKEAGYMWDEEKK